MKHPNLFSILSILIVLTPCPDRLSAQLFHQATNAGAAVTDNLPSVGGSWNDLNQDGYPELLITGFDVAKNNRLYLNQQDGSYSAALNSSFTQTPGTWGSVIGLLGDYDNDGDEDVMLCSYRDNVGQRLPLWLLVNSGAPDYQLEPDTAFTSPNGSYPAVSWIDYDLDGDLDLYLNHYNARDRFFRNDGNLVFTEIMDQPMLGISAYTNFNSWADFDNDGDLDLVLAHQTGGSSKAKIYLNQEGSFTQLSNEEAGDISTAVIAQAQSGGLADDDLDGDMDIYVVNTTSTAVAAPNFLFRNETGSQNNWLKVKLEGVESNRNGYGSKVFITAVINGDTVRQMRCVSGGTTGYSFQESTVQHFGLGDAEEVLTVEVRWLSGAVDVCSGMAINQEVRITEGSCLSSKVEEASLERAGLRWLSMYPNPGLGTVHCKVVLEKTTHLHWRLINEKGQAFTSGSSIFPAGEYSIPIQTEALPAGGYRVELWTKESRLFKSWVKAR